MHICGRDSCQWHLAGHILFDSRHVLSADRQHGAPLHSRAPVIDLERLTTKSISVPIGADDKARHYVMMTKLGQSGLATVDTTGQVFTGLIDSQSPRYETSNT